MANCWFPMWYIILLGMWRLSTKMIDCMRSIEISWNWSAAVSIRGRLRERQCGLIFLFKPNPKARTLSGRNDPMLTGSLASSSSSSMLLHSRGLRQEDYIQDQAGSNYGVMVFLFMILLSFLAFSSEVMLSSYLSSTIDPFFLLTWIIWEVAPFHHNCSC